MKAIKLFLTQSILVIFLVVFLSCYQASGRESAKQIVLVGCTPANDLIKSQLGIPAAEYIDFIRWELTFANEGSHHFLANITYGESQQNTLGFKGGGQKRSYNGEYTIVKQKDGLKNREIYSFNYNQSKSIFRMMKINDDLFHFVTIQNGLMVGNGGWSYTLNNKEPRANSSSMPALSTSYNIMNDTALQVVYNGRTPCQDFAGEHDIKVDPSCFKLKWKLVLRRDSLTHEPATYTIRKVVDNIPRDVTGNWTIIKGTNANPDAVLYQLDPDKPKETISLLAADENILYFLHKDKSLFVGNDNFSFTLNKALPKTN